MSANIRGRHGLSPPWAVQVRLCNLFSTVVPDSGRFQPSGFGGLKSRNLVWKRTTIWVSVRVILYNTLFSREVNFAKMGFEIFSREDIFANILSTRKYLPAKITSRENIFSRKYLSAIFFRAAKMYAGRPRLCGLGLVFHSLEDPIQLDFVQQ